uniref:Uncharacterized protein n=1 Tax=Rousettus aegyptiacus TaxID=9407 RepID=A0A7J8D6D8_ROUAE|nr:hypothetical protein HJG63_008756 [Rousettus aegyptiacus]
MFVSRGSRSCNSPGSGKAESAAPKGNRGSRVRRDLACLGTLAPVGSDVGEHLARGGPSSGLLALVVIERYPSAPCHLRQRWAMGVKNTKQTPGAAAGGLVNKSALDGGTSRPWGHSSWEAKHGVGGVGWRGWGAAGSGARDAAGAGNASLPLPRG